MRLGENLVVTLFGESHGAVVGALIEGMPPGIEIDPARLAEDMAARRPGGILASQRREPDDCEIIAGLFEGHTTGWPILLVIRNRDAKPSAYDFLPEQPRPGHADLPEMVRSKGHSDPRGGGSNSARLTAGLVAAASICRPLEERGDWSVEAHVHSIGDVVSDPIETLPSGEGEDYENTRCRDQVAAAKMVQLVKSLRKQRDSIGSVVELRISTLPLGFGSPWFDGIEPVLAHALMAIPGARAVEFGRGFESSRMRGSEHNDPWVETTAGPRPEGGRADGALGGIATGADLFVKVHFKPPSSIPREQQTLNLASGQKEALVVTGRHDPVLAPRAASVVESVARLVLADLAMTGVDESND